MEFMYLVVWSGGYDVPQYQAFPSEDEAVVRALKWAEDAEEGVDTMDVLRVVISHGDQWGRMERLESLEQGASWTYASVS